MTIVGHYSVKSPGRHRIYDYEKIKSLIAEGKKNPDIALEIGCKPSYICYLKTKWRIGRRQLKKKSVRA